MTDVDVVPPIVHPRGGNPWPRWLQVLAGSALGLSMTVAPIGYGILAARVTNVANSACASVNSTRSDVRSFLSDTVNRSERSLRATLDSPSSSPDQKMAAETNLAQLQAFVTKSNLRFAAQSCHH